MGEEGEGSFSLRLEEDESSQVAEQARLIERAVARGLEALDVDGRIERALNRRESAGSRHTGGASGSRVTMGVIPEKGALNGISVSNEPMGARGNTVTTVTASGGVRPVVMEGNRAGRGPAGGISTTPLVLSVDGTQPGEGADDLVVVGPTSLPVPRKLCDRIWDNQYVNMQELLPARLGAPDPSWKDLIEAVSKGKSTNMGKTIKSIEQWVACFNNYMIVMAMKHPERLLDLLAYSSKIVEASRCYEGTPWLAYDVHFRKQAAARKAINIAETDTSILDMVLW